MELVFLFDVCIFRSMDHYMGNVVVIFFWYDEDLASARQGEGNSLTAAVDLVAQFVEIVL